jgi:hypothetical protein
LNEPDGLGIAFDIEQKRAMGHQEKQYLLWSHITAQIDQLSSDLYEHQIWKQIQNLSTDLSTIHIVHMLFHIYSQE